MGVVGVCPRPQVFASSLGPQKVVQELGAILEVVTTHTPLPGLPALEARGVITGAPLHAASAAGPGQSVRKGGCGHRIQEGRLLETSLEQPRPPLQAAVPALMPELKLALEQAEVCGILQGLSQAWLPPTELLLPAGQLQEVTLLQVGPALCWGSGAQPGEGRQDLPPGQAKGSKRRETSDPWGL